MGESRTAFPRSFGTLGLETGGSKLMDLFYGAVPGTSVQVGQSEHWGTEFPPLGFLFPGAHLSQDSASCPHPILHLLHVIPSGPGVLG